MRKLWDDDAWAEYVYWETHDTKLLKKLNELIKEVERTPFEGRGKPEPLRGNLRGFWSRRITDEHRLIYRVENNILIISSCLGHYDD